MKDLEKAGSSKGKEKISEFTSGGNEFKSGKEIFKSGEEKVKYGGEGFNSGKELVNSGDEEEFESVMHKENIRQFRAVDQFGKFIEQETFEKHFEGLYEGIFDENATETFTVYIKEMILVSVHTHDIINQWNEELGGEKVVIYIDSDKEDDEKLEVVVKEEEGEKSVESDIGSSVRQAATCGRVKSRALKTFKLVPSRVVDLKKKMLGYKNKFSEKHYKLHLKNNLIIVGGMSSRSVGQMKVETLERN